MTNKQTTTPDAHDYSLQTLAANVFSIIVLRLDVPHWIQYVYHCCCWLLPIISIVVMRYKEVLGTSFLPSEFATHPHHTTTSSHSTHPFFLKFSLWHYHRSRRQRRPAYSLWNHHLPFLYIKFDNLRQGVLGKPHLKVFTLVPVRHLC